MYKIFSLVLMFVVSGCSPEKEKETYTIQDGSKPFGVSYKELTKEEVDDYRSKGYKVHKSIEPKQN